MQFANGRGLAEFQIPKKNLNGPNSWTVWHMAMKFCILIDIDKIYP